MPHAGILVASILICAARAVEVREGKVLTHVQEDINGVLTVANHPPVWTPNNEAACKKDSPPGGWGSGGPDDGEKNSQLFPDECLDPNPPDHCRGWGSGGCQPNDCHVTVTEDSGDLAPHGQRWACEVSDCNADDLGYATQNLNWGFALVEVEHPHYDNLCHNNEAPPCPTEHEPYDYTDPCVRSSCICPTWSSGDFWDQTPRAFFRQNDRCGSPLDNTPTCAYGGNPGTGGTGTIQFTTAPDRWGTFYYSVALYDDGISAPVCDGMCGAAVPCAGGCNNAVDINGVPAACNVNPPERTCKVCKLTILPVNDCPVWDSVGDVTVLEDQGGGCNSGRLPVAPKGDTGDRRWYGVCLNRWATDIGAGGWFEWPYQNTWFDCVTENTLLFEPGYLPRVDGVSKLTNDSCVRGCRQDSCQSRSLMFTLAPDQCGAARVTCTLHDDGGENDDGCDKSPPVTFEIKVECVNDPPAFITTRTAIQVSEDPCATTGDNLGTCHNGQWCEDNWATDITAGPANELDNYEFLVTVPATDEVYFTSLPIVDTNGRLCFGLAPHYNTEGRGAIPLSVVLRDSGGTANGGDDTSAAVAVALTVTPVNDVPTFKMPASVVVTEDSGLYSQTAFVYDICLGGFAGPTCADFNERSPAPSMQTATFTVVNPQPELFAVQPTVSAAGTLTFTPAQDMHGTVPVEVILCDNGTPEECSPPDVLIITIESVNDAPAVTAGDVVVIEDCNQPVPCAAGTYHAGSWVTITPGPDEESAQYVVIVSVTAADPSLFTSGGQPQVTRNGGLTFTPAPNAHGSTTVTIVTKDNGGTANGGIDTTATVFTVTLVPENDVPVVVPGSDIVVQEDSGPVTKLGWAAMDPGGREAEDGQTLLAPVCTSDATSMFAAAPQLTTEGNVLFTPQPDTSGVALVSCTVTDSQGAAEDFTFRITVSPVNDAPHFDLAVTLPLGLPVCKASTPCRVSIPVATNISPGPADESTQSLRWVVSVPASSANLFPSRSPPYVDAGGVLHAVMLPGATADGTLPFALSLIDDAGGDDTFTRELQVVVADSNNLPSFAVGGHAHVVEDGGLQTLQAWGSAFSAGAGEDAGVPLLVVTCTADDAALIKSIAMDITTGDLQVEPKADQYGTTVAHCRVDDGGSVNCCTEQAFQLTVMPVNDKPSFESNGSVAVWQDSGLSAEQWVEDVDPGPGESGQSFTYGVEVLQGRDLFVQDPVVDSGGVLSFEVAPGVYGVASARVRVKDNGGVLYGGVALGDWVPLSIVIRRRNLPPTFIANGDMSITVLEDAGTVTKPDWAVGASDGEADIAQGLRYVFTLGSGSTAVLTAPPTIADITAGDLTFAARPDASGTAQYSVALQDDGTSTPPNENTSPAVQLTINVLPVNDAPSFTHKGDVFAYTNDGTVVVPLWATSISPGPQEGGQVLVWEPAAATNAEVFTEPPTVTVQDGNLSFSVSPDNPGVSHVELCLKDNGGVEHGGTDRTCATIKVTVLESSSDSSLLRGSNISVLQTAGEVLVPGWVLLPSSGVQAVVDPLVPGLFTELPRVNPSNGDLQFSVSRMQTGTASVKVSSGGLEEWFTIEVEPALAQPSFTAGQRVVWGEGDPVYDQLWATQIDTGVPPGESHSGYSFQVSPVLGASLLEVQPTVGADGRLQLKGIAGAEGRAVYDVTLVRQGDTSFMGRSEGAQLVVDVVRASVLRPVFSFTVERVRVEGTTLVQDAVVVEGSGGVFSCDGGGGLVTVFEVQQDRSLHIEASGVGTAVMGCVLRDGAGGVSERHEVTVEVYETQTAGVTGEGEVVVLEDAGEVVLRDWISATGGAAVTTTTTHGELFTSLPVVNGGDVSFTVAEDAFGVAVVTVGGVYTFNVVVLGVNDPPVFSAEHSMMTARGLEVAWARSVAAGGGGWEADQRLTFRVEGTDFIDVSPEGVLRVAADAPAGDLVATVYLTDDGGRDHVGYDTSPPFRLSVTVDAQDGGTPLPTAATLSFTPITPITLTSRSFTAQIASEVTGTPPVSFTAVYAPGVFAGGAAVSPAGVLQGEVFANITVFMVDVTVRDAVGVGPTHRVQLVVGASKQTGGVYEVLIPFTVSLEALEAAVVRDLGRDVGLVVLDVADLAGQWRRVRFSLQEGGSELVASAASPTSNFSQLGGVLQQTQPGAPPATPPHVTPLTPPSSSFPIWLIPIFSLVGVVILASASFLAFRASKPHGEANAAPGGSKNSPGQYEKDAEGDSLPTNPLDSVFTQS